MWFYPSTLCIVEFMSFKQVHSVLGTHPWTIDFDKLLPI
jgi:hypothetical protein